MADVFDAATRSRLMSSVRTARTEPEELLARALRVRGLRYRRNDSGVPGTPDIAFRGVRLAIFVDGDFWHGRSWFEEGRAPGTNREFWVRKFEINRARDRLVDRTLRRSGWRVLRIWASAVKRDPDSAARRVVRRIDRLRREAEPAKPRGASRRSRATAWRGNVDNSE
jgi:DNA mismatch endonuclease (patch repair protein)